MATLLHDVRYAVRLLRARPGFAAVAILTLALGVGATTAIFSVVHAVLLSPLPFRDADRLVNIHIVGHEGATVPLPDADFVAWRSQNRTADAVAIFDTDGATLTGDGPPERVAAAWTSDRFFDVLGARPLLGRVLQEGDDRPGAPRTAVISHTLWTRRFHGDPSVIGRAIALNGRSYTIIGVMPPGFRFPEFPDTDVDLWRVLTIDPPTRRGPFYSTGIARLKPGVHLEELRANLDYPGPTDWVLTAIPLQESLVGNVRPILYALLGAVALLLLIATANVANLLLARAAARDREIAVRGALGAGRGRIAAQLVTESLVLAILGGGAGLIVAAWGTRALLAIAPEGIPRLAEVGMNTTVFAFAFAVSAACGVLFGVAPALRASRTALVETLKDGGRGGAGIGRRRAQRLLVVSEIALALMLSVGAGLMIRSFAALQRVSPGFEPSHLLTFRVSLPGVQYDTAAKVEGFYSSLVQRLEALAGVRAAGLTVSLPPHLLSMTDNFMTEGMTLPPNQAAPVGPLLFVSERYFTALGTPLVRGRFFTERDDRDAPAVVIINDALARQYFRGQDPVGKRLKNGGPERPDNQWMTIVGVVGDVNYSGLDTAPAPTVYFPFRQTADTGQYVVVRTAGDPRTLASAAREIVAALDKDLPVANLHTMDDLMAASVAAPRFRTTLVAIFAAVGLLLAAIGIYGVMSYAVTERTHEIGVRAALGAGRADVLRLVLGETLLLAALGVGVGVAGALATTQTIRALLFHVEPTDSSTFVAIALILVATALIASYIPARRALRVDPMVALRYE